MEPTTFTKDGDSVTTTSPSEAAQLQWDGWLRVGSAPANTTLPPGLPAYLELESLEAQFIERQDMVVSTTQPAATRPGMVWFKYTI